MNWDLSQEEIIDLKSLKKKHIPLLRRNDSDMNLTKATKNPLNLNSRIAFAVTESP